jgi:putative membrane protein
VISLLLLAIQVTSTGGLYPVQMLAAPFQLISPFLPLTYGVAGMQGIIAGGNAGSVVAAALTLLAFGLASVLVSLLVIRRTRRAQALGLATAHTLGSLGGQVPHVA